MCFDLKEYGRTGCFESEKTIKIKDDDRGN